MKEKMQNTPAKLNVPLSKTNPNRVNLILKEQHIKCTEFEKNIYQISGTDKSNRCESNSSFKI